MEPKNSNPINSWHIKLDNANHNYMQDPQDAKLWLALVQFVSHMAQQEERMEQAEMSRLEALDAQVQGDHHPQALGWILSARA